jgi:N-acylneuraminate cytidylyltransferase
MRLAVIPARGGSKRIPRKNIKDFCGKPIIAWSIEAARESRCFDRIIVSTDDEEIASVARNFGAETPFLRPSQLADDYSGTVPVIAHAIEWLRQHGELPAEVCCIYPTAPFVGPADLQDGHDLLTKTACDYVFSVTSYVFPIQRALRITQDKRVEMFWPEHSTTRSQDLEAAFHDAGQFYWGQADAWVTGRPIFSLAAKPIVLPRYRVQDIDTPEDWLRAEYMFKAISRA